MSRLVGVAIAVACAIIAVVVLRQTTMAVFTPPIRDAGLALVLQPVARYDGEGVEPRRQRQAFALAQLCALRVGARVVDRSTRADGELEVLIRPAVQGDAQDELEGCIEDLRVRRLLVYVESLRQVDVPGGGTSADGRERAAR